MKALVTGGGGFLGGAIATRLRARGDEVRSFSRGKYADLESLGVEHIQGDLADSEAVSEAVRGSDVVFHVGAKAGVWGPYADYFATNVTGTENVITACRREGVRTLVYTSTPSVVFGAEDLEGVDESVPYASRYDTWKEWTSPFLTPLATIPPIPKRRPLPNARCFSRTARSWPPLP